MSRLSLEAAIAPGVEILLDTSVVLAYLGGTEAASPLAVIVVDEFVRSGRNRARLSAVTVEETLVRPFSAGPAALTIVESFLQHFPNVTITAVDYAIAREAARIRAETRIRTPDALIVATAIVAGVKTVVTNDARWSEAILKAAPDLALCHLDAHLPLQTLG
jgi:predicted nucleic acid-binding protein